MTSDNIDKPYPGKVVHSYKDWSRLTDDRGSEAKTNNASDRYFPVKLHYMLQELEQDGLSHIVSWQPHGRCFVVHKQAEFVQKILPTWFRQTKFASFQRQLNLYGFKRLTTGRDKNGYYHERFLRGKRFLAHRIARHKLKGEGARKPTSPETEPNLYLLPPLPETSPKTSLRFGPTGTAHYTSLADSVLLRGLATQQTMQGLPPFLPSAGLQNASTVENLYASLQNSASNQPSAADLYAAIQASAAPQPNVSNMLASLQAAKNAQVAQSLVPQVAFPPATMNPQASQLELLQLRLLLQRQPQQLQSESDLALALALRQNLQK